MTQSHTPWHYMKYIIFKDLKSTLHIFNLCSQKKGENILAVIFQDNCLALSPFPNTIIRSLLTSLSFLY